MRKLWKLLEEPMLFLMDESLYINPFTNTNSATQGTKIMTLRYKIVSVPNKM